MTEIEAATLETNGDNQYLGRIGWLATRPRRAGVVAAGAATIVLLMGSEGGCSTTGQGGATAPPAAEQPAPGGTATLPPGGTPCHMDPNSFKPNFSCSPEIGGHYRAKGFFGSASFDVTLNGEWVAGDDVDFPVVACLDVGGQSVRFVQAKADVAQQIALYDGGC